MTSSLLIIVDSATLATMTMLVAAEKPPRNAKNVRPRSPYCMGKASTNVSPLKLPGGRSFSPARVIGTI